MTYEEASEASSRDGERAERATHGAREQALTVTAPDGYPLAATRFEPPDALDAPVVVLNGATGVPRRFYRHFAAALAGRGFRVLTYDYRGIAGSRHGSARSSDARMEQWGTHDLEGVLRYARRGLGAERVAVVGHSVGGQIVGLPDSRDMVCAVAGVGAQLGQLEHWSPIDRAKLLLFWHGMVAPVTAALGYFPGRLGVGEDLPRGVALEWRRWFLTRGYYFGLEGGEARRQAFARLAVPVLALSMEGDFYAPPGSVDAWSALFASGAVRREHVADRGVGHFGFFRREHAAHWPRVWDFLEQSARQGATA